MRMRPTVAAAAFVLVLIGWTSGAEACRCIPQPTPCEAFWADGAVFVGRVSAIEPNTKSGAPAWFGNRLIRFDVIEPFRGVTTPQVEVLTGSGGGDCGYPFKMNRTYLVYADQAKDAPVLGTGICSRTRRIDQA